MAIHETVEYRLHRVQQRLSVTDREQRSVHVSTLHITCVHDDKDNIFEHKFISGIFLPSFPSGGATPGRARSNDLAGRSTAPAPACLLLCFASLTRSVFHSELKTWPANPFLHRPFPTRTLRPSNDFTLLNGWICLHGVLDPSRFSNAL